MGAHQVVSIQGTMTDERLLDALLTWYRANRRTLPWREDPRPYYVLLSEFMCQQTRIDTVLPYFARFKERWPTLEDLASSSEEEVLQEWAGLGYYSRARNLRKAAISAVEAGGLTGDPEALRKLPGVGPYTAGAIASVAFNTAAPLIDGNVERVLCRLDGVHTDPRSTPGKKALWARAAVLIEDHPSPGEHNQALMELGALICSPRKPSCDTCPVADFCVSRAAGDAESLPKKPKKAPPRPVSGLCAVVEVDGLVLMGLRGPGLLAGMWEPVMGTEVESVAALLTSCAGVQPASAVHLGVVTHVFSHRKLTLQVVRATILGTPALGEGYLELRYIDPQNPGVALSKLALKVLDLAAAEQTALPLAADATMSGGWV
ncbi:MAG: A/G-specific adenine glycosylase [Myxococcota bacterium]|jgi:A/G-specific adenine glycosylase